jgi:hypothetical protein
MVLASEEKDSEDFARREATGRAPRRDPSRLLKHFHQLQEIEEGYPTGLASSSRCIQFEVSLP